MMFGGVAKRPQHENAVVNGRDSHLLNDQSTEEEAEMDESTYERRARLCSGESSVCLHAPYTHSTLVFTHAP